MLPRRALSLFRFATVLALLGLCSWGRATPIHLLVDTNLSTLKVSIDAFGKTDAETNHLAGFVDMDLDSLASPAQVAIEDFSMQTIGEMNFSLDFGFLGKATSKVDQLELHRFQPPASPEYVPRSGTGAFVVTNVKYRTFGDGSYTLTGFPCSLAEGAGRPCKDTVDFDSGPPGVISQITGTLQIKDNMAELMIQYFFSQPLDPTTPDLAIVSGPANIVAKGELVPRVDAGVRLQIEPYPSGIGILLRWPVAASAALQLVATDDLHPPIGWHQVEVMPVRNGDFLEVRLTESNGKRYFRLQ